MNFPHATADQWTAAQRILRGILSRHGVYGPDADDTVQQWTFKAMTKAHRKVCPVSPTAAAVGMKRLVAKYGIGRLLRETQPKAQTYARPVGRRGWTSRSPTTCSTWPRGRHRPAATRPPWPRPGNRLPSVCPASPNGPGPGA